MKPQVRVGVGCFVWKDDKFLMGQRKGPHGTGTWSVPGGWLEFGERLEYAAMREVLEETGVTVKNVRFITATNNVFENEHMHTITLWMEGEWDGGEPIITEPDKFVKHGWYTFQNLPSPLFESLVGSNCAL